MTVCFFFLFLGTVWADSGDKAKKGSLLGKVYLTAQAEKEKPAPFKLEDPEIEDEIYFGKKFRERLLELGVKEKFEILERDLIKSQIKSFIPPLLVPALTGHAFVMPPGLFQVAVGYKFAEVGGSDFFKNGLIDPIHTSNSLLRRFLTASFFYGFDLDRKFLHSFTARLNVPYLNSITNENGGPVHLPNIGGTGGGKDVFNGGVAEGIGDISLFIKKKLTDQANFPVGLAIAAGVFLPTGSNSEKVGDNGRIHVLNQDGSTFANPVFQRFTDDGELPAGLQPGTGQFSYKLGGFLTRQFVPGDMPDFLAGTRFDRAAIHMGIAYRWNKRNTDGTDRGDKATLFFSAVLPVYKDYVSLQVQNINFYQEKDRYQGKFRFPNQAGVTTGKNAVTQDRGSFRGGWTSLVGPSIIFSPDPLIRITASVLVRVQKPELGPSPPLIFNLSTGFIF